MKLVVFLELFEQYEEGKTYSIERTLANGLCDRGICVPFTVHQKMIKEAEELKAEKLLKAKKVVKTEKADSKKLKKTEKSVKK